MVLSFDGDVAIVTGAGAGLGRSHALDLARRGARVVVNDLGTALDGTAAGSSVAEAVVAEIVAAGGEAVANTDSVATPAGGASVVSTAMDAFGRVDIVVNNAGILRDASFAKVTPEQLDAILDVHLKGAFHVTQPAWRHMRDQAYGRVVTTSSPSGLFGNFGQSTYAAAKMGLVGFTRTLAIEGAKYGISANTIAPVARTRMTDDLLPAGADLPPEQITPVVTYLSHRSCAVTGHIYSVAGGKVARVFTGVTPGIHVDDLDAEAVAAAIDQIDDPEGYTIR